MTVTIEPIDPFEYAAQQFDPKVDYSTDPAAWGRDKLREFYWSKQVEVLQSVQDERYTAVHSCHDSGKSFIAARVAARWIDLFPPGEAFVVSTAPSTAQVSAILWREMNKAHIKGNLMGRITFAGYPKWVLPNNELVGYGRKPADYSMAAFSGIHALYVLVILDEAGGVDKALFDAIDTLVTNENARVLAIGNPDDATAHFAEVCKPDSGWNVIRIDGLRTPNFTEERVGSTVESCRQCRIVDASESMLQRLMREERIPFSTEEVPDDIRPRLLSPLWVEERLHRWVGRTTPDQSLSEASSQSALFTAKVRGLFPKADTEGVIPLGWVERAVARYRDWVDTGCPAPGGRRVVGVDVARSGEDETVLAIREGHIVRELRRFHKADTMETTGHVTAALTEPGSIAVVDSIGVGGGVIDRLRELHQSVVPFTASGSAKGLTDSTGEYGFINQRAYAWWNLREMLDPAKGSMIMLPDSELLKADLTVPRWKVTSGAKIQIESKDDIKKRIGRSTDEGDAVVQAHLRQASVAHVDTGQPDVVDWWQDIKPEDAAVESWDVEGLVS